MAYARWNTHSAVMRQKHSLPKVSSPWTDSSPTPCLRGLEASARMKDSLNVSFSMERDRLAAGTTTAQIVKDLFCDVSQGIQRKPWKTFCASSCPYSYEHDRLVSGYGALRALGFPMACVTPDAYSARQVRDLAGEAFSLPNMSLVVYALFANPYAPWWARSGARPI